MATVDVVCGLIFKENRILLAKRLPNKVLGGFWEFPGGKINPGEDATYCLQRELFEELGMSVRIVDHFFTNIHEYEFMTIQLKAYICLFQTASGVMVDHAEVSWVAIDKIFDFILAPADIPIAAHLMANQSNVLYQIASD